MITEDYVSFETAKLLKEKGFNIPITSVWVDHSKMIDYPAAISIYPYKEDWNSTKGGLEDIYFSAPTLQMAMKWLREVHKLVICAEIGNENFKGNTDYSNPDRWYWFFDITNEKGVVIDTESDFITNEYATYEEACEAAIKYCLEHLI